MSLLAYWLDARDVSLCLNLSFDSFSEAKAVSDFINKNIRNRYVSFAYGHHFNNFLCMNQILCSDIAEILL